jgi:hypothetical protein
MSTANFFNEMLTPEDRPSCHVCGAKMVPRGICDCSEIPHAKMQPCPDWKLTFWRCLSCGTTTSCS